MARASSKVYFEEVNIFVWILLENLAFSKIKNKNFSDKCFDYFARYKLF
jgi:hypothetical protein